MLVRLDGQITQDGQLVIELPDGLPAGEVKVTLEISAANDALTDAEIDAILSVQPARSREERIARLAEIEPSSWSEVDDPVGYVVEVKRKAWGGE
jgi:hypothetical protein